MKLVFSQADQDALEAALTEYGFSTEAGGANEGDEAAEERYHALSQLSGRVRAGEEAEISQLELESIREASWELGFSTDPGGAHEGDEAVEAQVALLSEIVFRAEHATL